MIITDFGFKWGSKEYLIAKELLAGTSREEVIRKFFPLVGKTTFIFRENVKDGRRQPKPLIDQRRLFLHHVNKTLNEMERKGWQNPEPVKDKIKWSSKERHWVRFRRNFIRDLERELVNSDPDPDSYKDDDADDDNNPFLDGVIPEPGTVSPVILSGGNNKPDLVVNDHKPGDEEFDENGNLVARWDKDVISGRIIKVHVPVPPKPKTIADHIEDFYAQMMTARDFTNNRALSGEVLDFISTRALKDGCKAIAHGVKVAHIMEAITKTWDDNAKRDLKNWKGTWKPKPSVIDFSEYPSPMPGAHQALGYVMCLAKARIPILLVGPSGAGKSFLARDLADVLDMPYGELPLTAGATPSWLAGRETITGYKSVPFVEIYADGGIFAQPLSAKVLTFEGWTTIGQLNVGDSIVGSDGKPQTVKRVIDRGLQQSFRVTFSDGTSTLCGSDHLWEVFSKNGTRYLKTTLQLKNDLQYDHFDDNGQGKLYQKYKWRIAETPKVLYGKKKLPLDPYLLGVLLGDGSFRANNVKFFNSESELVSHVRAVLPTGYSLKHYDPIQYHICKQDNRGGNQHKGQNEVNTIIRQLGLMGCDSETKFIPEMYLHSSVQDRLSLLQGLLDTDGSVSAHTSVCYGTISPKLCEGVCELVRSLGGRAHVYFDEKVCAYQVIFSLPGHKLFRLARKQAKLQDAQFRHHKKIVSIRPGLVLKMRCITVSNEDGLYITDDGIVTHNCFEEWDAADSNMLLLVNNALANEAFTNPVTGQEIEKHSNFIAIATANTWGIGANREFTGRNRIDAASRDRFRAGRLELDYDEKVERLIVDFWKKEATKIAGSHSKVKKARVAV